MSEDSDLFGNTIVEQNPRNSRPHTPTNDMGLIEYVLQVAESVGFVLVGPAEKVFRKSANNYIESAPGYESDAVHQLIKSGWLKVGGNHTYRVGARSGPAASVLVPRRTKEKAAQWRALAPLAGRTTPHTRKVS